MNKNQSTLNLHKVELEHYLQKLGGEVANVKNKVAQVKSEMSEIRESVTAMKTMIHRLCDSVERSNKSE